MVGPRLLTLKITDKTNIHIDMTIIKVKIQADENF
jgi:hypothetical protein